MRRLLAVPPLGDERNARLGAQDVYAMPPGAAPPQPPPAAGWRGAAAGSPPWAAPSGFGAQAHYPSPSRYALDERHAGTPTGYTPFYIAKRREAGTRRLHEPRQKPSELSVELWKSISDTWLATAIKWGLALILLHTSGLVVPLLAFFGYAPTQTALASGRSGAAVQPAVATLAAPSVIPERAASPGVVEDALSAGTGRRPAPQREVSGPTEVITRHYRAKPAHKPKPAAYSQHQGLPVASAASQAAAARGFSAVAPTSMPTKLNVVPQPLVAAAPESDDALGEAFLRINSRPWSEIFVDGTHVGHTPKLDLRVRAGVHRIRFVNQELGVSKTIELRATAGETVSHVEFLED